MKRLILALILLVVVLITGCADAGRRDQDKKSVHSPAVTLGIERIGEYEQLFAVLYYPKSENRFRRANCTRWVYGFRR